MMERGIAERGVAPARAGTREWAGLGVLALPTVLLGPRPAGRRRCDAHALDPVLDPHMFVDVRQRAVAIGVWATMFALDMAAGVGVALLGSLSTALYSARMAADLTVTSPAVDGYVTDSLAGALSATDRIPLELLRAAREAFTTGVNIASAVAGGIVVAAVVLCLVALRHVRPLGEQHVAADHDLLEYPGADGRHHGRRRE